VQKSEAGRNEVWRGRGGPVRRGKKTFRNGPLGRRCVRSSFQGEGGGVSTRPENLNYPFAFG